MRVYFILIFVFLLSACSTNRPVYAPVTDISMIERVPKNGEYIVKPGDSVYSIAWRFGLDDDALVSRNHLSAPYHLRIGQTLYLRETNSPPPLPIVPKHRIKNHATHTAKISIPTFEEHTWAWPAKGAIIGPFSGLNKGLNIAGRVGDPIYAAASGKVVYSGNGLKRYGNLIIIKHDNVFLSAYAHNQMILVKEGDVVKAGQKIAEMGNSGTQKVMLHFEIRMKGQPIDPLVYLSRRSSV